MKNVIKIGYVSMSMAFSLLVLLFFTDWRFAFQLALVSVMIEKVCIDFVGYLGWHEVPKLGLVHGQLANQ